MTKKMKIKLLPNGEIQMETQGVKGKKCLDYIEILNMYIKKDIFKIQKLVRLIGKNSKKGYNYFEILTTTRCNANCFYCYESNLNKTETMTKETAENLIQFMIKHRFGEQPLTIQWFGGEPLLNQRIIDYIVDRLNELEIPFSSTMISNAFLLNEETIEKLEKWKLKSIQITLDGLNDDYNKAKNYVYTDVDAYLTVMNNIHKL